MSIFDQLPSLRGFQPRFYTGSASRFHLPLLYDLVAVTKPRVVVVAGFGDGQAAMTLCQAVRATASNARCLVLRREDAETSADGDKDWLAARSFGEEMFGSFAEFRETAVDAVAAELADQSVDLLLIDDCDDGAAIRSELALLRPKLATSAIVALHGTALQRDDGPNRAFDMLPPDRVEFAAGIGLIVARNHGADAAAQTDVFFGERGKAELDELYRIAADRIDARAQAERLSRENSALQARQLWIDSVLQDRWKAQQIIEERIAEVKALRDDRAKAQQIVDERVADVKVLRRDRAKAQLVMDSQADQLKSWTAKATQLQIERDELKKQLRELKAVIQAAKSACRKRGRCFAQDGGAKVRRSTGERISREFARIGRRVQSFWSPPVPEPTNGVAPKVEPDRYATWIAKHEPDENALAEQRRRAREDPFTTKISLILPVYNTPENFLEELLVSLAAQTNENWEACIVDGGSDRIETTETLARWAARDPRFRIERLDENRGISENSNHALAMATGDFVVCVDHDDLLPPFALYEMAQAIARWPDADIFYSDEDRCTVNGKRHSPFFKPEWSPELLCSSMYIGHLTAYRCSLVEELGGFRKEFDLSQDYDLALRATERARAARHIPHVLYHWREHPESGSAGGKPDARKTNLAALAAAMRRRHLPAEIIEYPTANRAKLRITSPRRVSVIVPTDSAPRAKSCAIELPQRTTYADWEVVIVTNSALAETIEALGTDRVAVRAVRYDKPFNFSDKCNVGAAAATGDRLIFLNDDVQATEPDWIENVIEQLENPEVGAVSPKLLYENGKIQHAGLVTGVRGFCGTAFHQWAGDSTEYFNLAQSLRDVSALSAACLAVRREDFERVGGFDAVNTPIAHSDIDFCFKLRELGLRCVYTPFATLRHVGHASIGEEERAATPKPREAVNVFLLKRWARFTTHDPYFTGSMREWLYHDSPTPIRMWGDRNSDDVSAKANLLLVSHDLSWSGAPLILLEIARWCKEQGLFVVVMSPKEGQLQEKFVEAGIPLIVDSLITTGHPSFTDFAKEFDCAVASTIFGAPVISALKQVNVPHLWWIHEGRVAEHYLSSDVTLRRALAAAETIVTPDSRSAAVYQPFSEHEVRVLPYGIHDPALRVSPAPRRADQPLIFLLLGTIEQRKGQLVLLEAIEKLPADVVAACRFQIIGRSHEVAITRQVEAAAKTNPSLICRDGVAPDEALALIDGCDVMLSASFDETGPLIVMEALGLGKAVVCTNVGAVAECLIDDEQALFFEPGDAAALANAIERLVRNPQLLERLRANSRPAYEKYFAFERFGREFIALVEGVIAGVPAQ